MGHVAGGIVAGARQKMQLLAFGVAVLLGVGEFWFCWSSFVPRLAAKKSEPQKRDSRTKQASLRWARLTVWTPAASASTCVENAGDGYEGTLPGESTR